MNRFEAKKPSPLLGLGLVRVRVSRQVAGSATVVFRVP